MVVKGSNPSWVCLVSLVHRVHFIQPNQPKKPNEPNNGLEVVCDTGNGVEGTVHAAESKAGGIEVRDRGVVIFPF